MLERIYISLWGIYFIALSLFFVGGMHTAGVVVVFGFVFFSMVFLGMIGVMLDYATHNKMPLKH